MGNSSAAISYKLSGLSTVFTRISFVPKALNELTRFFFDGWAEEKGRLGGEFPGVDDRGRGTQIF
jgi:hypothetical protein